MLRNYIKIALRNLIKHKAFSIINITGLTLGVACCMLLLLYIKDEKSYDLHYAHIDDLYRVTTKFQNQDGNMHAMPTASPPIAMALWEEFPEIMSATRVVNLKKDLLQYGGKSFFETKGILADSTFFRMFDYEFLEGNSETALKQPNTIVLTESLAHKIFGSHPAFGETITISDNDGKYDYKVTGVLKDTGDKTHIEATYFTSMSSEGLGQYVSQENNWGGQNFVFSYIQLHPNASPEALEAKLPAFLYKYGAKDLEELGLNKSLHLQPVKDIHLKSDFSFDLSNNSSMLYIYVMSAIAAFILLIACINFMNLSTAKAAQRASEVGVRKTMGASRSVLVRQFMGESLVIVAMATLLGIFLVDLLLPYFNNLTGKNISLGSFSLWYYLGAGIALTLFTGLLAGSYPAFFLSSFQPAQVLKGKVGEHLSAAFLRKLLVVSQFVVAICLISGVIIMLDQIDYVRHKALGFEASSRIVIPLRTRSAAENYPQLKDKLAQQGGIYQVAASSIIPGSMVLNDFKLYPPGSNMDNAVMCKIYYVDEDFTDLLDLKILEGRTFDRTRSTDHDNRILANPAALKQWGIPQENAVGQKLYTEWAGETREFEIIGIVNDFHQLSLHQPISPMIFQLGEENRFDYMITSVRPEDMQQTLTTIESIWAEINPGMPLEYVFLDERIQRQYDADRKASQIIGSFTLVAILISCLGLYGLSAFVAERKEKEIGIRKVLGASTRSIVVLLSKNFTRLVVIAFLISIPLSYYVMDRWLQNFAYRIDIGLHVFAIAGSIALLIALLTVSYHAVRAALANPVDSLHSE